MADSPQMTKQIKDVQSNPLEAIKALLGIVQSVGEQQKAGSDLNSQQNTANVRNAYQKGVDKALSEHGYNHGTEALAAGTDPNQIANHEAMQPQQPAMSMNNGGVGDSNGNDITPQHIATLASLLNSVNPNSTSNNSSSSNTMTPIQQQAMDVIAPATGPLGKIFEAAGFGTQTKAKQLKNLQMAQGIMQETPESKLQLSQASNTNAVAEMQRMTNAGNKPIDPEQYMTAYSQMYQKAYEAHASVAKTGGDMAKSAQELMKSTADQTRNALEKTAGMQSKESQATLESAIASQKAALDATGDFSRFMSQNSPEGVIKSIKQNVSKNSSVQKQSGLVKPGQSITINGKTIKRLN